MIVLSDILGDAKPYQALRVLDEASTGMMQSCRVSDRPMRYACGCNRSLSGLSQTEKVQSKFGGEEEELEIIEERKDTRRVH